MVVRRSLIWIASILTLTGCSLQHSINAGPILFDDFETISGSLAATMPNDRRLEIVEDEGVGGSRALRVEYVGGPMGSERLVGGLPLPPALEYTLNYDVRFARDFQFVLGGKLHGLGPKRPVSGGQALRPNGWSARVMWRQNGRAEIYAYHQDQKGRYGEAGSPTTPSHLQPGRYHAVSLHVKVNGSSRARDGFVRLYIDGGLIEAREDLRLRATDGLSGLISTFLFSTFHGGNHPDWAPRSDDGSYANVIAFFDNFAVYPGERIRARPGA